MPATPIAALLYVFLLIPGLVYLSRVEAHRPARVRSVFRETATVVFASVGASSAVLLLLLIASLKWPEPIHALTTYLGSQESTFSLHPRAVIGSMFVFLLVATAVAWAAGTRKVHDWAFNRVIRAGIGPRVHLLTGWDSVLEPGVPSNEIYVGVQLKAGGWLEGVHAYHSDVELENGDRALVLQPPIKSRPAKGDKSASIEPFDRLVVQSSEIEYIVTFERVPDNGEA